MRSLTLAAMTAFALTASVAYADVSETFALNYNLGASFDGTIVCTDDFSSVISMTGTLTGYDSGLTGFQGAGSSDLITAVSPLNYALGSPNLFSTQLWDSTYANFADFEYTYDSSGITLDSNNAIDNENLLVSASVTPTSVPEPGTLALLTLGLLGLGVTRHRPTRRAIGCRIG